MDPSTTPLAPVELVVLQGTPLCNLNCSYCDLSAASRRAPRVMPLTTIERVFVELFASGRTAKAITVVWHSGEPTTLPPGYYDAAITRILELRDAHATGPVTVSFDMQTNGVRIDRAWCDFFRRHAGHLRVGVSVDGPAAMHDAFRVNWTGAPTHAKTLRGMDLLHQHGIPFKAIAVVSARALVDPDSFFGFFHAYRDRLEGFHFNVLASGEAASDPELSYGSRDRERYNTFYRRLLNLCRVADANGEGLEIQNFTQALARILTGRADADASFMEAASAPLRTLNVTADGNVTTFYAGLAPEVHAELYGDSNGLCLGNILETPLETMVASAKLQRIMGDFRTSREACRDGCPYFAVCPGGFELTKVERHGRFDAVETPECAIHVQALVDALLDDIEAHVQAVPPRVASAADVVATRRRVE